MKIYTKTGDEGQTGLFGGTRVGKDDPQVQVYGAVDELNAVLGLALTYSLPEPYPTFIQEVQSLLFVLGAELATAPGQESKLKLPLIAASHIEQLELRIDEMESELHPLKQFILPGGNRAAATLHLARTVCRRAEREFVSLQRLRREDASQAPRSELGVYLNRLSDFLFVLARYCNHRADISDIPWQK